MEIEHPAPAGLRGVPCPAPSCDRCTRLAGGYHFRWLDRRWTPGLALAFRTYAALSGDDLHRLAAVHAWPRGLVRRRILRSGPLANALNLEAASATTSSAASPASGPGTLRGSWSLVEPEWAEFGSDNACPECGTVWTYTDRGRDWDTMHNWCAVCSIPLRPTQMVQGHVSSQ